MWGREGVLGPMLFGSQDLWRMEGERVMSRVTIHPGWEYGTSCPPSSLFLPPSHSPSPPSSHTPPSQVNSTLQGEVEEEQHAATGRQGSHSACFAAFLVQCTASLLCQTAPHAQDWPLKSRAIPRKMG